MEKPLSARALPVYGYILAAICIFFTIIFYATKLYSNLWMGYLGNTVMFLGVLIAIIHYNRSHKEKSSAMTLFTMGLRTTVLATVLYAVFLVIFHLVVGGTPENSLVQTDDPVKENFWIYFLGNVLFINLFVGVIAAGMGAMVFKSNQKTEKSREA